MEKTDYSIPYMYKKALYFQFLISIIALIPAEFFAQVSTIFPYSRYGLGETSLSSHTQGSGMGGESFSLGGPYNLNYANPASAGFMNTQSIIFETGFMNRLQRLNHDSMDPFNYNHFYLSHIAFGFPISSYWKASLGIIPFSRIYYSYSEVRDFDQTGKLYYLFSGNGEVNRLFFSNAFSYKWISLGVDISYLFGNIRYRSDAIAESTAFTDMFALYKSDDLAISDVVLGTGILFRKKLGGMELSAGISYRPSAQVHTHYDALAMNVDRTFFDIPNSVFVNDTAYFSQTNEEITLPGKTGFGISVEKEKWLVKADMAFEKWSDYKSPVYVYDLNNSRSVSVGFQYTPDASSVNSFRKQTRYRMGIFVNETPFSFHGTRITGNGMSFGAGFPLKRTRSTVNVSIEAGRTGTVENNLFKEEFIRAGVSFALHDIWFIKKKID